MTKITEPNPVSLLARLRHLGRSAYPNIPANAMLLLYAQQGLLARLERSQHRQHFVLKGALSLFVRFGDAARPTEDIDLAARHLPNTKEAVIERLTEICAIPFVDGLQLIVNESSARIINDQLEYPGVSVVIQASLGGSRANLQIDVSFGNAITPEPVALSFPKLLLGQGVVVHVYPLETVIAEKFAALAEIGETTTRMKDIYDLHTLIERQTFEARLMRLAFERSFAARGTDPVAIEMALSDDLAASEVLTQRWRQYLNRNKFQAPMFAEVMRRIHTFCRPIIVDHLELGRWTPEQGWEAAPNNAD
jgi:predicted nucleotidyltransferase component of viral defense system